MLVKRPAIKSFVNSLAAILCLATAAALGESGKTDEPTGFPKMTGSFIQLPCPWFQRVYSHQPPEDRVHFLDQLWYQDAQDRKMLKFDTVVIQYSVYDTNVFVSEDVEVQHATLRPNKTGDIVYRSVDAITADPQTHVWVGLRGSCRWNGMSWWNLVGSGEPFVQDNLAVARALGSARNIKGWYIPSEIDNATVTDQAEAIQSGNKKLKSLVDSLRSKPVAISGFFRESKGNMGFTEFSKSLEQTLNGTGIKVFIFQDGVGVSDTGNPPKRALSADEISTLKSRYAALSRICKELDIQLWIAVELMTGEIAPSKATSLERLKSQLAATEVEGVQKVIGFSSSHHLTRLLEPEGDQRANALFKDYVDYVADHTSRP
jgi:hypothetical protein